MPLSTESSRFSLGTFVGIGSCPGTQFQNHEGNLLPQIE